MSLTFTIKGWHTPPSGRCPCDTCEYAAHIRGRNQQQDIRMCRRLDKELPFEPVECEAWEERGVVPLYKMEQMAWNLLNDRRGNPIGFHSPAKTRDLVEDGKAVKPESVDPDF